MSKISVSKYEKEIKKVRSVSERAAQALAYKVLREVVIPVCKKYDLNFSSGMGSYDFSANKGAIGILQWDDSLSQDRLEHIVYQAEDAVQDEDHQLPVGYVKQIKEMQQDLDKAYKVLNLETERGVDIGHLINDYRDK